MIGKNKPQSYTGNASWARSTTPSGNGGQQGPLGPGESARPNSGAQHGAPTGLRPANNSSIYHDSHHDSVSFSTESGGGHDDSRINGLTSSFMAAWS